MTVDTGMQQRMMIRSDMVVTLPRHVHLRFNKPREMWLLLAPERVLDPDPIAVTVLQMCDGQRTVHSVCQDLAKIYAAPVDRIETDVIAMLQDLADKGFLAEGTPT